MFLYITWKFSLFEYSGTTLTTFYTLLSPRFCKKASGILQSPPSVCPSVTLSPPKPLDEIQPNLVCELLTWMGCATAHFFGPAPWGPGEGPKGQISLNIIKFQLLSQFQDFFNQTLCVFSHMKDIKHIRRDFYLVAPGYALGMGLRGTVGGLGGHFFRNSTRFGVWVAYMNGTRTGTIFWVPAPWGLWEGPKGQISLNLNNKVNFKGFKTKLCVSSHKRKIYNISDGIFIRLPGSCPGVGLGCNVGG